MYRLQFIYYADHVECCPLLVTYDKKLTFSLFSLRCGVAWLNELWTNILSSLNIKKKKEYFLKFQNVVLSLLNDAYKLPSPPTVIWPWVGLSQHRKYLYVGPMFIIHHCSLCFYNLRKLPSLHKISEAYQQSTKHNMFSSGGDILKLWHVMARRA